MAVEYFDNEIDDSIAFTTARNPMGYQPYSKMKTPWKKWFAWHPVTIRGERVWWKYIYRRREVMWRDSFNTDNIEYGTILDVLKEEYNDEPHH